jgi:hypothetical protein
LHNAGASRRENASVYLECEVVIACDKREAFAQGSGSDEAIQLSFLLLDGLLRLRSMTVDGFWAAQTRSILLTIPAADYLLALRFRAFLV